MKKIRSISLEEEAWDKIKKISKSQKRSVNNFLQVLIMEYIDLFELPKKK